MTRERPGERGFALIAAIWFVALMAFVGIVIAGWMSRSVGLATRLQDRLASRIAIVDAENQVEYRMVSGFFSPRGLEMPQGDELTAAMAPEAAFGYQFGAGTTYVALDNEQYRLGMAVVRLQDDNGLYTLDFPNRLLLGSLLRRYGLDANDRDVLLDRLFDYMGKSVFQRLNGASAVDYAAAGRPPPRDGPLLTPWEALRVLSWDGYPALWQEPGALPDLTTIGTHVLLNPTTAPEAILASLPGMDEDAARRVLLYRRRFVIQNSVDFDQAAGTGVGVSPMSLVFFPADSIDVTISAPKTPLVYRMHLQLSPIAPAPIRIGYAVGLPEDSASPSNSVTLAQLPVFPDATLKPAQ